MRHLLYAITGDVVLGGVLSTTGIGTSVSAGSLRPPGFPVRLFCSIGFGGLPTFAMPSTYQFFNTQVVMPIVCQQTQ
jgi:hypothetical protein